jgi:hypothetical protein
MRFIDGTTGVTATRNNYTQVQTAATSSGLVNSTFTDFTFAAWVNTGTVSLTQNRMIAGKMGGSGQRGWSIGSSAGNTDLTVDYFDAAGSATSRTLVLPNGTLPEGIWTHIAVTFDGGISEKIYINGVETPFSLGVGSAASPLATWNSLNTMDLKIGHRGAAANNIGGWNGGLDDVRIYDTTLTELEVQALLVPVPEPGSLVLMTLGIIGLAASRRHKKSE